MQREVFGGLLAVDELADGYALHFPGDAAWLATLAEFIRFELHCAPEDGSLRLSVRGPDGAKALVAALLGARE